jgi:hypothetical protein
MTMQHRPMHPRKETHFSCLDLCDLCWNSKQPQEDNAILLEIWHTGGLFQVGTALPKNLKVTIGGASGEWHVEGTVSRCQQDAYGFLAEIHVKSPRDWFPRAYQPPYLLRRNRSVAQHAGQSSVQKILRAG